MGEFCQEVFIAQLKNLKDISYLFLIASYQSGQLHEVYTHHHYPLDRMGGDEVYTHHHYHLIGHEDW